VQAALHQQFGPAGPHQLHGLGGGRVAVRRVDDRGGAEIDAIAVGHVLDLGGRADENRRDQSFRSGFEGRDECGRLTGMGDGCRHRIQTATAFEQLLVLAST
jgi:hypothetical protein